MSTPIRVVAWAFLAVLLVPSLLPLFITDASGAKVTQVVLAPTEDSDIDSSFASNNYGSSTGLSALYYDFFNTRHIQTWLKFDISSIPPGATVTSAVLTLTLAYTRVNTNIGVYSVSSNSWSESSITWNNAPRSSVSSSYNALNYVTNSTSSYGWDVSSIISSSLGGASMSLVVQPTASQSQNINGWTVFYSKEGGGSSARPTLTITYSYVSASVSISPTSIQYGGSATIVGSTDPVQTGGTMTLQYSVDQANWNNIASQTGGTYTYDWRPTSTGTYYVRSVWSITWSVGSYTATSSSMALVVGKTSSSVELSSSSNSITPTGSVTLTLTLTPQVSDGTVSIQYSTDQVIWIQIASGTPSSGRYSYTWSPGVVGTYYLRATWSGNANYASATSSTITLMVGRLTTSIILNSPTSAKLDETVAITTTLRDSGNNPVPGATITVTLDSAVIGTAITDSSGSVTIPYKLSVNAGSHTIAASYEGSTTYSPSSAQAGLIVNPWILVITSTVPQVPLVSLNGINYTTDISGKVVIRVNSTDVYQLGVNSPLLISSGTRVVFLKWNDDSTSTSKAINMDSDLTLSISTKQQHYLTVQSSYGKPMGEGWYDSGSKADFSVQSTVDQGNGTRRILTGWLKDSNPFLKSVNGSVDMTAPTNLLVTWNKQYYVNIESQYGNPTGTGWYDAGATVTGSIQSPFPGSNGTRYVATGFEGSGSAPQAGTGSSVTFTLGAPSSLDFKWKTQYYLTGKSEFSQIVGQDWYDAGARATISIKDTQIPVNVLVYKVFNGWTGDTTGTTQSISVTVDGPKSVSAVWADDYTRLYLAGGGVAVVVVALSAFYLKRMRSHKPPTQ